MTGQLPEDDYAATYPDPDDGDWWDLCGENLAQQLIDDREPREEPPL